MSALTLSPLAVTAVMVVILAVVGLVWRATFSPRDEPAARLQEFGDVLVDLVRGRRE
jgi:hypothetical protein